MTDRDLIARALLDCENIPREALDDPQASYTARSDAARILAALDAAGRVITVQGAIAAAERRGMERAAAICDERVMESAFHKLPGAIEATHCATAIRADMEGVK